HRRLAARAGRAQPVAVDGDLLDEVVSGDQALHGRRGTVPDFADAVGVHHLHDLQRGPAHVGVLLGQLRLLLRRQLLLCLLLCLLLRRPCLLRRRLGRPCLGLLRRRGADKSQEGGGQQETVVHSGSSNGNWMSAKSTARRGIARKGGAGWRCQARPVLAEQGIPGPAPAGAAGRRRRQRALHACGTGRALRRCRTRRARPPCHDSTSNSTATSSNSTSCSSSPACATAAVPARPWWPAARCAWTAPWKRARPARSGPDSEWTWATSASTSCQPERTGRPACHRDARVDTVSSASLPPERRA